MPLRSTFSGERQLASVAALPNGYRLLHVVQVLLVLQGQVRPT
ncbi:hypothetical protein [Kovacikia minuta]|nr:hypothetical protein [Kovacikia minuta]